MNVEKDEYPKSDGSKTGDAGEARPKTEDASVSGAGRTGNQGRSASDWISVLNRIIPSAGKSQNKHAVVLKKEAPESGPVYTARKEIRSKDLTAAWKTGPRPDAGPAEALSWDKSKSAADVARPPVAEPSVPAEVAVESVEPEPGYLSESVAGSKDEPTPPVAEPSVPAEVAVENVEPESGYLSESVAGPEEEPGVPTESFEIEVFEVQGINQEYDLETRDDFMKKSKDSRGSLAGSKTSMAMRDALMKQSHETQAVERMVKSDSRDESRDRKPQKEQGKSMAAMAAIVSKKPQERDIPKEKEMKPKAEIEAIVGRAAIDAMVGRAEKDEPSKPRPGDTSDRKFRVNVEPLGAGIVNVVSDSAKGVAELGKSAVNSIGDAASSAKERIAGRSRDEASGKGALAAAGETAAKVTETVANTVVSAFKGVGTLAGYVATGAVAAPVDLANGISNAVKRLCSCGKKDKSAD